LSNALKTGMVLLLALLAASMGIATLLLSALGTERGTALLARQIQSQLGEQLQWQRVDGTLLGTLHLQGLQLSQPGLQAEVDKLTLSWQPVSLFSGNLQVTALEIDGIQVTLSTVESAPPAEPFNPASLQLPIDVSVQGVSLRDLTLLQRGPQQTTGPATQALKITEITLDALLQDNELTLQSAAIRMPEGGASILGSALLAERMPLDLAANWDWLLPANESGEPGAQPAAATPLSGAFSLAGEILWRDGVNFNLGYRISASDLSRLHPELPALLTGSGKLQGDLRDDELGIEHATLAFDEAPMQLSVEATASMLGTDHPGIQASVNWTRLQWPMTAAQAGVASPEGRLLLTGTTASWKAELHTAVAGTDIPPGEWQLQASGSPDEAMLDELVGQVLQGEVRLSGPLRWTPYPQWELQLHGRDLNPAALRADFPGKLAFSADSHGSLLPGEGLRAAVVLQSLSGQLLGYPLRVQASASLTERDIALHELQLNSSDNRLSAKGTLSAQALALDWSLRAPSPGTLVEGASGVLEARGRLEGTPESPYLLAELSGDRLQLNALSLSRLSASVRAGPALDAGLALQLDADALSNAGDTLLHTLTLRADGTTARHRLNMEARQDKQQLRAILQGGLDATLSAWQGELAELSADTQGYGIWELGEAAALSLSAEQISVAKNCIAQRNGESRLCTAVDWQSSGSGAIEAQLHDLPLKLLSDRMSGGASAGLRANLGPEGALRARGDIHISPGEVSVELEQNRQNLAFSGGDITFHIDESGLRANVNLGLPETGRVNGTLALPELTALPISADQPLAGRMQAHLPRLDAVTTWVPEIARSSGRLDADFTLAGTTAAPKLTGGMSLHGGRADIPLAGLELREIDLQITSDGALADDISIVGSMVSGRGQLQLSGSANPMQQSARLQLQGENVQVYATPDARVWLSPELTLGWQDETLSLRGQLTIPDAAITPKLELSPGAMGNDEDEQATPGQVIAPSADVVVINRNVEPPETLLNEPAPFRIDSKVKLVLGDNVHINAVGFVSHITGAVLFTNTPAQAGLIPNAKGRLALQGGTFRALGQDLEIENGQIIFANVPATQPELDLRAVRWIDNDPQVTAAGVTVTGPALEPVLELFSRPQLETSEIQSYLLTGRSPRSKDNVLGLGTYISPRIYVGYGYNMVEKTSEFNSLFTISPRYGLGANVGEADNNINVTFTYER